MTLHNLTGLTHWHTHSVHELENDASTRTPLLARAYACETLCCVFVARNLKSALLPDLRDAHALDFARSCVAQTLSRLPRSLCSTEALTTARL